MFGKLKKRYTSEEAVKRALKIDTFRNVPKKKIMEFVSMIPYMDKDVAIAIIRQFPAFADFGKTTILYYMQMCDNILKENHDSQMMVIQGYQTILEALSKQLETENLAEEEKKFIIDRMIEVADKIEEADLQNKKFLDKITTKAAVMVAIAGGFVAAVLGINSSFGSQGELPTVEDDEGDNDDSIEST